MENGYTGYTPNALPVLVILSSSVYIVRHRFEKSRVSQEDFQKIEGEWNAYLTAGKEHIKIRLSQDACLIRNY